MTVSAQDEHSRVREAEKRRIIGIVLKRYAEAKLAGAPDIAHALDALATEIEHGA